ncbi:hypothetical protein [Streptomyces platensis]|nr:hypothetical protein [Streptomyces platensis]WUB78025.1 hypothetical protein OG424_01785 [Streptomyces platensis]
MRTRVRQRGRAVAGCGFTARIPRRRRLLRIAPDEYACRPVVEI